MLLSTLGCGILGRTAVVADEKDKGTDDRLRLLKTYRSEFIAITPGQKQFPQEFEV